MAVAIIGVCLLGVSKGGFLGLGVMALPLMSLFVPPLQAAAIILPTAIAQDFLTLWIYRREWSAWNIKIMLPSMMFGMFCAWLLAAHPVGGAYPARHRADRDTVRAAALDGEGISRNGRQNPASRPASCSARSAA